MFDLNYNFEFDRLIELSDDNLSDKNEVSELVENRSFLNQSQSRNYNFYYYIGYRDSYGENIRMLRVT